MGILSILASHDLYKLRKYRIYQSLLRDYVKRPADASLLEILKIHRKGFLVSDWKVMGLTDENYKNYLSSKQYSSFHPINGYYSKLIDDKMVIKYVLNGTELAKYAPDYYLLIDESGHIFPLMDCETKKEAYTAQDVLELLKEKKALAIKLATGSIGKGFYKGEYADGRAFVNGEAMTDEQFCRFVGTLKNYIVSEYLRPHPDLAAFWPDTANTLRYLLCRIDEDYCMLKSFIRFGSKKTGYVENFNRGGVMCYIQEDGSFDGGYVIQSSGKELSARPVSEHPDTKLPLQGVIPHWDEIQKAAVGIAKLLPQTRFLGYDFVVTDDDRVKLLEINSLTSLDALEMDTSILQTEVGRKFFSSLKKQ